MAETADNKRSKVKGFFCYFRIGGDLLCPALIVLLNLFSLFWNMSSQDKDKWLVLKDLNIKRPFIEEASNIPTAHLKYRNYTTCKFTFQLTIKK